jgi:hypothetical protein
MRCEKHLVLIGHKRNAYRVLMGKPEGYRSLARLNLAPRGLHSHENMNPKHSPYLRVIYIHIYIV